MLDRGLANLHALSAQADAGAGVAQATDEAEAEQEEVAATGQNEKSKKRKSKRKRGIAGKFHHMLGQMVAKRIKKVPSSDDVVYDVREDAEAPKDSRFSARVTLARVDGTPSIQGPPRKNKKEAREAAAEALFEDPAMQAALQPLEVQDLRPRSRGRLQTLRLEAEHKFSSVQKLDQLVANKLGKPSRVGEVSYVVSTSKWNAEAPYVARVDLNILKGSPSRLGEPAETQTMARSSAAEAVLADRVLRAQLARDPIAGLRNAVAKRLRREVAKGDIVFTVHEGLLTPLLDGGAAWRASAALAAAGRHGDEEGKGAAPSAEGSLSQSAEEAKMSAAAALLEVQEVQTWLRARSY